MQNFYLSKGVFLHKHLKFADNISSLSGKVVENENMNLQRSRILSLKTILN